jgi:nucleoside phosphorylase
LPLEANAVLSLFDQFFDNDPSLTYRDPTDPNSYSLGVMGGRNVVLAHQPLMGKATAASVAAFCACSFRRVKLALLVGVCGGVPVKKNKEEILLGDVIISKGVMQYDFGRQFSDGFRRKIDVEHSLGRPNQR